MNSGSTSERDSRTDAVSDGDITYSERKLERCLADLKNCEEIFKEDFFPLATEIRILFLFDETKY